MNPTTRRRRLTAVAVLTTLALAVAACGSDADTASTEAPADDVETTEAPAGDSGDAAATGDCETGPITVGIIPKLGDDPYMTTVRDGMQKAADELGQGDEIIYTSPSEATGAAQIPFVQQLISSDVDVIAIAGSDLDSAKAELENARERGIDVIAFDSDVATDARTLFINQAESSVLGTKMLDSMNELLGGEGQFAILSSTQTAVNQNAWIANMEERLAAGEFPGLELVGVAYGEEKADLSATRAVELVTQYPDLGGIIIPAGISLPAAATALSDSGDLGDVKLTGLAPATLISEFIKTGDVQDIWWNVTDLGYLSMYAAKAVSQCGVDGTVGTMFDGGALGEYEVGENGEVILGPAQIVTPENVDEFAF
jgi:rhamnose transport system substrate-binding protein